MNPTCTPGATPEFRCPVAPKHGRFLAVIVYEDEATFLRADTICHDLIREFHDAELDCFWVAFRGLANAMLARDAAEKAAEADLIVFSAHAGPRLPEQVEQWIESWLPHKNLEETALAALVGLATDGKKGVTPIHTYLQEVAARRHMDFIPQVIAADTQGPGSAGERPPDAYEIRSTFVLTQRLVPQHWGLNE